jgi:hypothetical protein
MVLSNDGISFAQAVTLPFNFAVATLKMDDEQSHAYFSSGSII